MAHLSLCCFVGIVMFDYSTLPFFVLLGLSLFFGFDGGDDEASGGTLGDSASGNLDEGELTSEKPVTFLRFDDQDNVAPLGDGNQEAYGEAGNDQIAGEAGDDRIFLNAGNDKSFLDADNDNRPDDPIAEAQGDDFIRGGDGEDILIDGEGANEVFGDLKADFIDTTENDPSAGDAEDTAYGGFGSDTLIGDDGDILYGGENKDAFFVQYDATTDDPVTIADYQVNETITIQLPEDTPVTDATAALNESGTGTDVSLDGQVILTVEGLTNLDALNLVVEATL